MKYKQQRAGLEERQKAFDALPAQEKNSQRRPGSLQAGGPTKRRSGKRR